MVYTCVKTSLGQSIAPGSSGAEEPHINFNADEAHTLTPSSESVAFNTAFEKTIDFQCSPSYQDPSKAPSLISEALLASISGAQPSFSQVLSLSRLCD
jgi:hypothetical protein